MGKRGRKDKYFSHIEPYLKKIPKMYETMTEAQIAKKLGVSVASWERYKTEHPELLEALKFGKEDLIEELKATLKKKAKGYYYTEKKKIIREYKGEKEKVIEEHEKYAQPDTGAAHLLLKNLDPDWHNDDKQTMELKRKQVELQERKLELDEW